MPIEQPADGDTSWGNEVRAAIAAVNALEGVTAATLPETIRDTISSTVVGSGLVTVTPNDVADTVTVATSATANSTDAQLRTRSTHTGTQTSATISDLTETIQDVVGALIVAGTNVSATYNDVAGALTISAAGGSSGGSGDSGAATTLHRLVENTVTGYATRPSYGYVDFLGWTDPGAALLAGDTWTQIAVPSSGTTVPGAPTIGTATAGDGQATVTFTAPSSNGGATITGYTVTSTPGGLTGTGASSPITVSGLTNSTAYTFKVKATNSAGTGPESAASNSVTPTGSGTALTDTFTGANGDPWSSSVWKSTIPSGVTMDIQSNQGRALWTAGTFDEKDRRFAPANSANWRSRGQIVTAPSLTGWGLEVVLQATTWDTGVPTPETAYKLILSNGGYFIVRRVSNASTTIVPAVTLSGAKWWDIQVVAGVLKYRVWTGVLGDAPAFTTATNTTPITGTGQAGLTFTSGDTAGTNDFRIDNVLVDTNPAA